MNWIYSLVMNTVNSSLPTASSRMKLKYITPVWAVRYMEEEVSCPIFSYHRIQPYDFVLPHGCQPWTDYPLHVRLYRPKPQHFAEIRYSEKMETYLKGQNLLNKFAAWAEKKA